MSEVLIFAEQRDKEIKKVTFENISLAKKIFNTGNVLLIGNNVEGLAAEVGKFGADNVQVFQHQGLEQYQAEAYAKILSEVVKESGYKTVIMGATAMGKDLAPRIAARLNASVATDVISLDLENGELKIIRPMYAGKVRATVKLHSEIKIITVRPNVYMTEENQVNANITVKDADISDTRLIVKEILTGAKDKLDVTEADIIVSGGRGMKDVDNFHLIEDLAKKLGAATGASRAVVDAGWRPYAEQVGQTGKTVSPSLYIAVGISGAIQHLAGMSSSKYIVAINKDPEAPIFKIADYGIVGDLFEVVPKMLETL